MISNEQMGIRHLLHFSVPPVPLIHPRMVFAILFRKNCPSPILLLSSHASGSRKLKNLLPEPFRDQRMAEPFKELVTLLTQANSQASTFQCRPATIYSSTHHASCDLASHWLPRHLGSLIFGCILAIIICSLYVTLVRPAGYNLTRRVHNKPFGVISWQSHRLMETSISTI